jgi:hypothetical protein
MPNVTEIINALIGFFLSVILGAFFQRWLSRAKPTFIIRAVGFQGSEKLIKLPDKLISLSDNPWLYQLKTYSSFEDLIMAHKNALESIERLRIAIPLAANWVKENSNDKMLAVSFAEIKKHPFVNSGTINGRIIGMVKRNELQKAPISSLDEIQKYERVTDLKHTKEAWILDLEERMANFKFDEVDSDNRMKDLEICAESFARGIKQNIIHYMQGFVNVANRDLNEINEYKQLLEEALLPEARLSVELSIYNSGQSAVAIRPHMGLKILHPSFEKKTFILSVQKKNTVDINKTNETTKSPISGSEVVVESFLPETSANPYISVSPGEMQEVVLLAAEALGKANGEIIKNIYQTGLLTCKIVGQTITNKHVWSSPAVFSNQITSDEKTKLEKIVTAH